MPAESAAVTASVPRKWRLKAGLIIAVVVAVLLLVMAAESSPRVLLGNKTFRVEVARTGEERLRGLSGRERLADGKAMLFVFDESDKHCFWMKSMKFSIDILWFDENRRLVHQARNVSPDSFPDNFCPPKEALYVLEVPAGTSKRMDMQNGDQINFRNL